MCNQPNNSDKIKALHYWLFVQGIYRWKQDFRHKRLVMQKVFPHMMSYLKDQLPYALGNLLVNWLLAWVQTFSPNFWQVAYLEVSLCNIWNGCNKNMKAGINRNIPITWTQNQDKDSKHSNCEILWKMTSMGHILIKHHTCTKSGTDQPNTRKFTTPMIHLLIHLTYDLYSRRATFLWLQDYSN